MLPFVIGAKRGLRPLLGNWRLLQTSASVSKPAEPKPVAMSKLKDSFNDATSVAYLEDLERRFNVDPASIDKTWASFFTSLGEWGGVDSSWVWSLTSRFSCPCMQSAVTHQGGDITLPVHHL